MAQAARDLRMWLEDQGKKISHLIKDGDKKITAEFDQIIEPTAATVKKISRKVPEMGSFAESRVASIKRECLDHFMVPGERHLERLPESHVGYYSSKRLHRGRRRNLPPAPAGNRLRWLPSGRRRLHPSFAA